MEPNDIIIEQANKYSISLKDAVNLLAKQEGSNYSTLTKDDLNEMLQNPQSFLFIARHKQNEKIVGMIMMLIYRIPYTKKAYVDDLVVDESFRNMGIATKLLEHAVSVAKEHNVAYIMLTAHIQRAAGNHLYQKLGFQKRESNVYRLELSNEKV